MSEVKTEINCTDYMKDRVDDQLSYYASAANAAKRKFHMMQSSIIVLGLLVPVIVNLPLEWSFDGVKYDITQGIQLVVTVLSLTLAILTGLLNFKKFGELWLTYRMTEESLKRQKFLFLARSGKYAAENAFDIFVQSIESLISNEHNEFHSLIQETSQSKENKGSEGSGEAV